MEKKSGASRTLCKYTLKWQEYQNNCQGLYGENGSIVKGSLLKGFSLEPINVSPTGTAKEPFINPIFLKAICFSDILSQKERQQGTVC